MPATQSIVIVGGGLGIGLETTKDLLQNTASSTKLIVFTLHADDELTTSLMEQHAGRLSLILGDVTDANDQQKAVRTCIKVAGSLDTLIYSAGVITPIERIDAVDVDAVDVYAVDVDAVDVDAVRKTYEVNVFGVIEMCQLVLPHIRKSSTTPPRIVILSSACDLSVTYKGWMAYCTSKAALTRFVQLLAHENPDIQVQGVYPRLTRTLMPAMTISGKYKGIMADEEVERFQTWSKQENVVEPASWCGEAVARLAMGAEDGGESGKTLYYDEHVPSIMDRKM